MAIVPLLIQASDGVAFGRTTSFNPYLSFWLSMEASTSSGGGLIHPIKPLD